MHRSLKLRPPFDRTQDFVALKDFMFMGRHYVAGSLFDKTKVTDRRLRQLYDNRTLNHAGLFTHDGVKGPDFDNMEEKSLREWLEANTGHKPHELATKERLIARCKRRWSELKAAEANAATGLATADGDGEAPPPSAFEDPNMEPFVPGEQPVDEPVPAPASVNHVAPEPSGEAKGRGQSRRRQLGAQKAATPLRDR